MATRMDVIGRNGILITMNKYMGQNIPLGVPDPVESLKVMEEIKYQEGDVIISTFPKTGTHWICSLVHMVLHDTTDHSNMLLPMICGWRNNLSYILDSPAPRLMATHLGYQLLPKQHKQNKGKLIVMFRNPKGTSTSLYHHTQKSKRIQFNGTWDEFFDVFRDSSQAIYCDYLDRILDWERAIQENPEYEILPVFYEALQRDCVSELKRICKYLGVNRSHSFLEHVAEQCNMEKAKASVARIPVVKEYFERWSQDNSSTFIYRKGMVGDWKNQFTVAQNEIYDNILERKLKNCRFKFEYELKS